MTTGIEQIAEATTTVLAPFLPFLVDTGKIVGQKITEVIAEKGGEAAWKRAEMLWNRMHMHFENDAEVNSAVTMVAISPNNEIRQKMLTEVLEERLKTDPKLAEDIFKLLGGQQSVQQVLAEGGSWIADITQHIAGTTGSQSVIARDVSNIKEIKQDIRHP